MIRRPPRSTLDRSSAASDVYKRQGIDRELALGIGMAREHAVEGLLAYQHESRAQRQWPEKAPVTTVFGDGRQRNIGSAHEAARYHHGRAGENRSDPSLLGISRAGEADSTQLMARRGSGIRNVACRCTKTRQARVPRRGSRCGVPDPRAVSYTHLRAHETVLDLVCRLLLEKKKETKKQTQSHNRRERKHS